MYQPDCKHSHGLRGRAVEEAAAAAERRPPLVELGGVPHHEDTLVVDGAPVAVASVVQETGLGILEELDDSGDADPQSRAFLKMFQEKEKNNEKGETIPVFAYFGSARWKREALAVDMGSFL